MTDPYPQHPAVFTDDHCHYLCRCGEPVMLSVNGQDIRPCRCGRRHSWDGETIGIIRPEGEREHE